MISEAFATYGPDVLAWVFSALGALLSAYVWTLVRATFAREALQRAWLEVQGAVLEVAQTYSEEIRLARVDGKLTADERALARARAIEIAKANLGSKGLARLGRVIGVDVDRWLASKTEQAVRTLKTPAGEAPLPSALGAEVPPLPQSGRPPATPATPATGVPTPRRPT